MRSLWLQEALAGEDDAAPLEREEQADVCIVGGGYTGLWTALKLKEHDPSLDVVIVEADVCGGGASGRNGGFVMSWWSKFLKLGHLCGEEEALRLARASAEAVSAIGEFCEVHSIDADFREDGWLWAATKEARSVPGMKPWLQPSGREPTRSSGSIPTRRRAGRDRQHTLVACSSRHARRCNRRASHEASGAWRSSRACESSSAPR